MLPVENRFVSNAPALCIVTATSACGGSDTTSPIVRTGAQIACESPGMGRAHQQHAAFQAILEKYVDERFPGISAAIYTPDGLWVSAAGYANVQDGVQMTTCHALFSGSVAKTYTVAAAMRLVEDGHLGLDAPIAPQLPQSVAQRLPNASLANVRQLMNHSAGMPDHDENAALDAYVESHNGGLPSAANQLDVAVDQHFWPWVIRFVLVPSFVQAERRDDLAIDLI